MEYFLERIAKDLHRQYGKGLKDHCLVFPSRRAGLYYLKYYASLLDKPVWTPNILTIGEFFSTFSELIVAENELLLFELYKVYRKIKKSPEGFDEFYFWGDMLISDFDDLDKYMVDASVLFRNVNDLKSIDLQFRETSLEQTEVIRRFWKNFEPENQTPQKEGFISVWSLLYDLYKAFRESLRLRNIAYEGLICRDVAESFLSGLQPGLKWEMVHFVGFNALNKCELTIMTQLRNRNQAKFYWDFDTSYIKRGKLNSAGMFLTGNLAALGNDMDREWNYDTLLTSGESEVTRVVIETNSDIAQVKLLPAILSKLPCISPDDAHHTAVILADENLIVPLLTSLPSGIGDVNITMGYPMKMTGVYSFIKHILNLQANSVSENGKLFFRYQDVNEVLQHHLVTRILSGPDLSVSDEIIKRNILRVPEEFISRSDSLRKIFRKPDNPQIFSDYLSALLIELLNVQKTENVQDENQLNKDKLTNEFIYSALLGVTRLDSIIRSPEISFTNDTYIRILDKVLKSISVPFEGEPLSGIQIMGFLESRALDFRNIIMLSVNEGVLPSVSAPYSFIPFSLREAFDMPVINHKESVYAYHFYRLLHRAENVTYIFNSDSGGLRTGERSRFLTQMRYELINKPVPVNIGIDIRIPVSVNHEVRKNDAHLRKLISLYEVPDGSSVMSPTAINTWLGCSMRFYYRYVCGLKEPEVIKPGIDNATFGQILHLIMKSAYLNHRGRVVTSQFIDSLLKDEGYITDLIDNAIRKNYNSDPQRQLSGNDIIVSDILRIYFIKILKADKSLSAFNIIDLEGSYKFNLSFGSGGEERTIRTGGIIDRIDSVGDLFRIVDYKTGDISGSIDSLDDLFGDDRKREHDGWLQTMIYCEAFLDTNRSVKVKPTVYKVKELSSASYNDSLIIKSLAGNDGFVDDYLAVREEFLCGLKGVISRIFNPDENFRMTKDTNKCRYCPYSGLCQR